jgi:DeoR/GlpR family transcriptional regulator of sugar metabolism
MKNYSRDFNDGSKVLDNLVDVLGADTESESFHEITSELNELGYNVEAFQSRISELERAKHSQTNGSVSNEIHPHGRLIEIGGDCESVYHLLELVGHELDTVMKSAVFELRLMWQNNREALVHCLTQLTNAAITNEERLEVHAVLSRDLHNIRVLAYRDFRVATDANEIADWLQKPKTRIYRIVKSRSRQIYAALVDCEGKDFVAALVECGRNRFIQIVNQRLVGHDYVEAMAHELEHNFDIICSNQTNPPLPIMANPPLPIVQPNANTLVPFAQAQKQVDPDDKDLVARWIGDELRLSNGAGVFLDAGSQCMMLWKAIREKVRKNLYSHLAVRTNNFLVLDQWVQDQTLHPQGNTIETVGDVFDVGHLAFYGPAAKSRLMEGDFRPTVYIGTSGIEFSDGSILFGYHQGSLEGDFKQLLFKCPARSRVILATPQKIGNAGGRVFDLLKLDGLNVSAPIILVTTNPQKGTAAEKTFQEAQKALREESMQEAIRKKGIRFTWVTVDRDSRDVPKALETFTVPAPS